jgi:hypothetical protein
MARVLLELFREQLPRFASVCKSSFHATDRSALSC